MNHDFTSIKTSDSSSLQSITEFDLGLNQVELFFSNTRSEQYKPSSELEDYSIFISTRSFIYFIFIIMHVCFIKHLNEITCNLSPYHIPKLAIRFRVLLKIEHFLPCFYQSISRRKEVREEEGKKKTKRKEKKESQRREKNRIKEKKKKREGGLKRGKNRGSVPYFLSSRGKEEDE